MRRFLYGLLLGFAKLAHCEFLDDGFGAIPEAGLHLPGLIPDAVFDVKDPMLAARLEERSLNQHAPQRQRANHAYEYGYPHGETKSHDGKKMTPGGYIDKKPSNLGHRCKRDSECHTHARLAAAICNSRGRCDIRCLGKTVRKGNQCYGTYKGGLDDPNQLNCEDGHYQPVNVHNYTSPRPNITYPQYGSDCEFDPNTFSSATTIDSCFYDLAFQQQTVSNILESCVEQGLNYKNWIQKISALYGQGPYTECDANSCSIDTLPVPDGRDTQATVAMFFAIVAASRYVRYLASNNFVIQTALTDFLSESDGLTNVINQLQTDKVYGPGAPAWESELLSGLSLLGTFIGLAGAAVPFLGGLAAAGDTLNFAGAAFGLGTGGASAMLNTISNKYGPSQPATVDVVAITGYLKECGSGYGSLINNTISTTTANITAMFQNMEDSGSAAMWLLAPLADPDYWTDSSKYLNATTLLLNAWSASIVMQSIKLFLHHDYGCSGGALTVANGMPGVACLSWDDGGNGINLTESLMYPVAYNANPTFIREYQDSSNASPPFPLAYVARTYDSANNLDNFNWQSATGSYSWFLVHISSWHCQIEVNQNSGLQSSTMYPSIDLTGISGQWSFDSVELVNIPCLFNLPISSIYFDEQVGQCSAVNGCCGGQVDDPGCPSYDFTNLYYCHNSIGLDDWVAGSLLKLPTWGDGEGAWPPGCSYPLQNQCYPPNCCPYGCADGGFSLACSNGGCAADYQDRQACSGQPGATRRKPSKSSSKPSKSSKPRRGHRGKSKSHHGGK